MRAGRRLELLFRLHRRELDRERRGLAELDDRVAEEARIEAFPVEPAGELTPGADRPEGGPFLGGYLEGSRRREAGLRAELGELRARRSGSASGSPRPGGTGSSRRGPLSTPASASGGSCTNRRRGARGRA